MHRCSNERRSPRIYLRRIYKEIQEFRWEKGRDIQHLQAFCPENPWEYEERNREEGR